MTRAWVRPAVIVGGVAVLLGLNTREFRIRRRGLETRIRAMPDDGSPLLELARRQALQAQTGEQLLHMIHTMLAAILAALLWK